MTTHYTETERNIVQIVDDEWTFEQIEGLVRLATHYDEAEAFDAADEIAQQTIYA
ncbi:hypothetical protein [Natrarchaeobaculum sulfurireducens]|uniref:Uncharacterized protein n=1 Tax=Natrarchaeobaculum sulfurireducens TaxID=2044521 RepID=A0A346PPS2_9EURY|nr:hypothetical protein [Natrarchaeobaculum sulfurireducens]AXR81517.1 hypothetical protein AArcMg_1504 [Natrarchaeobaculum sulfurireducens]